MKSRKSNKSKPDFPDYLVQKVQNPFRVLDWTGCSPEIGKGEGGPINWKRESAAALSKLSAQSCRKA
jgi:hypothetical protein